MRKTAPSATTRNHRLIHCIGSLAIGGAERQVVLLCSALEFLGWETHIAIGGEDDEIQQKVGPNTILHRIPKRGNYDPRIPLRLAQLIRRIRPAVVHTWLPQMDVYGGVAALTNGVPWIICEQASADAYREWRGIARSVVGRFADGVIANSQQGLLWWRTRNPHWRYHRVIANIMAPLPPDLGERPSRNGTPRIIFVGRLAVQKRVETLIQAVPFVLQSTNVELVICGDGPEAPFLRHIAARCGLSGIVRFTGFVNDVPKQLRASDVFVSLSAFEGMPNTVVEAIAEGIPMVLSDIAEHREIVDDDSAILVNREDPLAVAAAVIATLTDRDAARKRAITAHRRIGEWSLETIAATWDSYYREVLSGEK